MRKDGMWKLVAHGVWAAWIGKFKLVVLQGDKCARFLIARPKSNDEPLAQALLQSGTRQDVTVAKAAAETQAHRLERVYATASHAALADRSLHPA